MKSVCLCPPYEMNPSNVTLVMIARHRRLKPVISIRNSLHVLALPDR